MKRNVIHLKEIDSTNRWLHDLKTAPADVMTVVVADYQTSGKGQGTNRWESEPGANLLMSILIHPTWVHPSKQFILSKVGALAVGDALSGYVDGITLKWPNDIYWHDSKISGTLIETSVNSQGVQRCIFGIGVNVNQSVFLSDAPNPVSLVQILHRQVPVEEVMGRVLDELDCNLALLERGDEDELDKRYHQSLYRREGWHGYQDKDGPFMAAIKHVASDGHLVLFDESHCERSYAFKEVTFLL